MNVMKSLFWQCTRASWGGWVGMAEQGREQRACAPQCGSAHRGRYEGNAVLSTAQLFG